MVDIVLETLRSLILMGILLYLWFAGRSRFEHLRRGWRFVLIGFAFLSFGSVIDITDNFDSLNKYVFVGNTKVQAVLEKFVGFLGGFILIGIGVVLWIPRVQAMSDLVGERTNDLRHTNEHLRREIAHRAREFTEREVAEAALEISEARLKEAVRIAKLGNYVWDEVESKLSYCDEELARIYGVSVEEVIASSSSDEDDLLWTHPDDRERYRAFMADEERSRMPMQIQYRIVRRDGQVRHIQLLGKPVFDETGGLIKTVGIIQDITERKSTEEALFESEQLHRELFDESPVAIWIEDWSALKLLLEDLARGGVTDLREFFKDHPDKFGEAYDTSKVVDISRATCDLFGAPNKRALIEATRADLETDEELGGFLDSMIAFTSGETKFYYEAKDRKLDGTPIVTANTLVIPPPHLHDWSRVLWAIDDITERKYAEDALRDSNELSDRIFHSSPGLSAISRPEDGRHYNVNSAWTKTLGYSHEEAMARSAVELGVWANPEERAAFVKCLQTDGSVRNFDATFRTKGGKTLDVLVAGEYLKLADGPRLLIVCHDITERKRAEDQLRQSQRMEAVGQLTGGIAHDFNNILAIIMGHADLLEEKLGRDNPNISEILDSATRGADLTKRLLAFSRQQPLQPKAIDIGSIVSDMSELLARTLGETIEIQTSVAPDLESALADQSQVENALLNLALNARDAMPSGGKLKIECGNILLDESYVTMNAEATRGDFVVVEVSDDGSGMSADVRAHAFEPFFTTKEVGQGSGLGLSMVYGFAKQSGGHATLYSEQGKGTTVKLYLPRAEQVPQDKSVSRDEDIPRGAGETILLIEDDPVVRAMAVLMLEDLGYRVTDVANAASAHKALAQGTSFNLVLSDVVLPGGISGPQFAEKAQITYPDLKIIFMSGYPSAPAMHIGLLGPNKVLLDKPFRTSELAKVIRDAVDQGSSELLSKAHNAVL